MQSGGTRVQRGMVPALWKAAIPVARVFRRKLWRGAAAGRVPDLRCHVGSPCVSTPRTRNSIALECTACPHSISPRCQRANASGSWTTTTRSSSPPWVGLADLGESACSTSSQLRLPVPRQQPAAGSPNRWSCPALREPSTVEEEGRPHPQHYARVGLFGRSGRPTLDPECLERPHHPRTARDLLRSAGSIEPGPSGLRRMSSTPARSRVPRGCSGEQATVQARGAVGDLVEGPAGQAMTMLRRMMIDQRSARKPPRGPRNGQYCP